MRWNRSLSTVQLYTAQLTFEKAFGGHHINASAVYDYQGQQHVRKMQTEISCQTLQTKAALKKAGFVFTTHRFSDFFHNCAETSIPLQLKSTI